MKSGKITLELVLSLIMLAGLSIFISFQASYVVGGIVFIISVIALILGLSNKVGAYLIEVITSLLLLLWTLFADPSTGGSCIGICLGNYFLLATIRLAAIAVVFVSLLLLVKTIIKTNNK